MKANPEKKYKIVTILNGLMDIMLMQTMKVTPSNLMGMKAKKVEREALTAGVMQRGVSRRISVPITLIPFGINHLVRSRTI